MSFKEIALLCLLVDKYNSEKPDLMDSQWRNEFSSLMKRGYLDLHGNPTRLGKNQAYYRKKLKVNFTDEAKKRGIRYAISMVLGGLEGIEFNLGQEPELEKKFLNTIDDWKKNTFIQTGEQRQVFQSQ